MKSKCSFKGTGVWIVWFSQVCLFTGYWYWVLSELFVFHECVLSLGTGVSSTPPTGICHQTNEAGGGTRLDTRTPNPEHWDTNVQWGNILKKNLWGKLNPFWLQRKLIFSTFGLSTEHNKVLGLACWIIGGFFENWGWSHLHLDHIAQGDPVGESARCVGGSERTFCPPCCAGKAPTLYFELTPDTDPLCSCRHCGHLTKTPDHLISSAWHHNVTWTHLARWEVHTCVWLSVFIIFSLKLFFWWAICQLTDFFCFRTTLEKLYGNGGEVTEMLQHVWWIMLNLWWKVLEANCWDST